MSLPTQYSKATDTQLAFALNDEALSKHIILITGATGGLGTVLSKACAAAGATVVLAGRNLKKLEALYDVVDAMGSAQPAMLTINQDSATVEVYQDVVDKLGAEFGQIDALVHTAADLGTLTPLPAVTQADWTRVMAVNLSSARLLTAACLPLLYKSSLASVVFTLDHKASAYWGAYGISKSALLALSCMLADENDGRKGDDDAPLLAINSIDPGPMRTPLRRRAFPGEIEAESPTPDTRLAPFLSLITRADRQLTGASLYLQD